MNIGRCRDCTGNVLVTVNHKVRSVGDSGAGNKVARGDVDAADWERGRVDGDGCQERRGDERKGLGRRKGQHGEE